MLKPSRGTNASNCNGWWMVNNASDEKAVTNTNDAQATRPLVIFDGACGFCTWCVHAAQRYVQAPMDYAPYQHLELAAWGLHEDQVSASVYVITSSTTLSGARAVAAIMKRGRRPWPVLGSILDAPVLRPFAERGYRFVARHRGRLPGVAPAINADT